MTKILLYLIFIYFYGSFSEWFAHRYLMHRRVKAIPWAFEEHNKHHAAYPAGRFNDDAKDNKYLNLTLCIDHILFFSASLGLLALLYDPLLTFMVLAYTPLHFYLFRLVHTAMHLRHKLPFVPDIYYWTHFMHHQYPNKFYCVVLPGFDYLAGTWCRMTDKDHKAWQRAKAGMHFLIRPPDEVKEDREAEAFQNRCEFTKYSINGFVPPAPKAPNVKWIMDWQVGPIRVHGELPDGGPYIIASSHGSWKDPFILMHLFPGIRVFTHIGIMRMLWGLVGYVFGRFLGSISCGPGNNEAAIKAGVEVLQSGQNLGICPEGWAWTDGVLRAFKTGAARIAKESNTPIVPIYIRYKHYLPTKFTTLPPWQQYLITAFPPFQASGAEVFIGPPIKDLTKDIRSITLDLQEAISNESNNNP